jgi:hypothetical protein
MDREMSNPRKVPRKKQRPLSNTVMSEREKKLAVLLEKKRQMDLEIEALQGERPETESDPGPSTVEESAEEVEDPANRDWRKIALALAERERPAPVAVATIQLPSLLSFRQDRATTPSCSWRGSRATTPRSGSIALTSWTR